MFAKNKNIKLKCEVDARINLTVFTVVLESL